MVQVKLVDPRQLPGRIAGVAVHAPDDTTYLMRDDLTAHQLADWINALGRREPGAANGTRGRAPAPE